MPVIPVYSELTAINRTGRSPCSEILIFAGFRKFFEEKKFTQERSTNRILRAEYEIEPPQVEIENSGWLKLRAKLRKLRQIKTQKLRI